MLHSRSRRLEQREEAVMKDPYIRLTAGVLAISFGCALGIYLVFLMRLVQMKMDEEKIQKPSPDVLLQLVKEVQLPLQCGKIWFFLMLFWTVFCLFGGSVTLGQWKRQEEARFSFDLWFIFMGLLFFYIGMSIRYLLWKKRRMATASVQATVVSIEPGRGVDNSIVYRPVYKFYAEGIMHRIVSPKGHNTSPVKEGERVKLYYIPGQPGKILVPQEQRAIRRISIFFCVLGTLSPFAGLLAPWLRLL